MEYSILADGRTNSLSDQQVVTPGPGRMAVSPQVLKAVLGWELKPEGLCGLDGGGEVCFPVRDREALMPRDAGGKIELAAFADLLGRPIVIDCDERVAALGTAAERREASMETLEAPDFELPDLNGRLHTLSEHRGKKVLLIAYASW